MSTAFGDARTIPASDEAKRIMNQLKAKELFPEQRDVWTLGAALGLDSEETFAAVMLGRYPDMSSEERLKKLVDHAEWGIREIWRKHENGTLDFSTLGTSG